MLQLDNNTLQYFQERKATKIKLFFYDAGCSGTKLNITDEFEIDESLCTIPLLGKEGLGVVCYVDKRDLSKFENCSITRVETADHTGKVKVRYIYKSEEVKGRCGCGSSFSFGEGKKVKLDLGKLKDFKKNIHHES